MNSIFPELNPQDDNENSIFNLLSSNNSENKNISQNINFSNNLSAAPEFNQNDENLNLNIIMDNLNDKGNMVQMMERGLLPLFIKIEKYKPIFFMCNKRAKLKKIINAYAKMFNIENISNYIFYKGNEKLNINLTIEDSNVKNFDIIKSEQLEN